MHRVKQLNDFLIKDFSLDIDSELKKNLKDEYINSLQEIKLKNNRMVMFPCCYLHSVSPIKFHTKPKKIGYGKYTITHFFYSVPTGKVD